MIYHGTISGKKEIQYKAHALTQCERLVLICVANGITYSDLCEKLKGLPEDRLYRALFNLMKKKFIAEALRPFKNRQLKEIDLKATDQMSRQNAVGPVTVLPFDAEEWVEMDSIAVEI